MRLLRVRIEQLRQFRKPFEIGELEAGLNLFTGPNEAGKSTVVEAIRCAIFERHRSNMAEALRPWGDSSASPSVELDFEWQGELYQLSKSFLGKKRCDLRSGSRKWTGAEAEDHLADLFGFQFAGSGASSAKHWGIPGLLWVQQGTLQEVQSSVVHATDHLRQALQGSVSEVLSGRGEEVLARVEAARRELLTESKGAPRGDYLESIQDEERLQAELSLLNERIEQYREKVDRLASLRKEHERAERERPWSALREEEKNARARWEMVRAVELELEQEKARLEQLEDKLRLLLEQQVALKRQEQELVQRESAWQKAKAAEAQAEIAVQSWTAPLEGAEERFTQAQKILRLVREQEQCRLSRAQLAEAEEQLRLTKERLERASELHAACLQLREREGQLRIDPEEVKRLRAWDNKLLELRAQMNVIGTSLRFQLVEGRKLHIGGRTHEGAGEAVLSETTRLDLEGWGTLQITPGGKDLAVLHRQIQRLSEERSALLLALQLSSLEQAEARVEEYKQAQIELRTTALRLKELAPRGVDALRAEWIDKQRTLEEKRQADGGRSISEEQESRLDLPSIEQAIAEEESAFTARQRVVDQRDQARVAFERAQMALESATSELSRLREMLADPAHTARVTNTAQRLQESEVVKGLIQAKLEELRRRLERERPDILRQDMDRLARSAELEETAHRGRRDRIVALESELAALGAQGLEGSRAECEVKLERARRRLEELRLRASALDLLKQKIVSHRTTLTNKIQEPLQEKIQHYLELVFRGASVELDEKLSPGALSRAGNSSLFQELSFGAREQMGLISRLAYADLLQEAGRPTLLLFDDILVHSDPERLRLMKQILFDAGERHQILIFTCHPDNWRDLGVRARSLEELRAASRTT